MENFNVLLYLGCAEDQLCLVADSLFINKNEFEKIKKKSFANGGICHDVVYQVKKGRSKNYMQKMFGTTGEAYDKIITIMDDLQPVK